MFTKNFGIGIRLCALSYWVRYGGVIASRVGYSPVTLLTFGKSMTYIDLMIDDGNLTESRC